MSIRERVESDLKKAMLGGDTVGRDTLRMVLSGLKNRRIEVGAELTEEQELGVLTTAVKTRRESVEQYAKAGRDDLASRERAEIEVIQAYLPTQLSEDETRAIVTRLIGELGISSSKDIGKLMKPIMGEFKGRVDGKIVQRIAGELLE
jgi:hypothetical protein